MMTCAVLSLAFLVGVVALVGSTSTPGQQNIDILMPGVRPSKNDEVLCHAKKIDKSIFITSFNPSAKMGTAHHMLLFACSNPGLEEKSWNCGEMEGDAKFKDGYHLGNPCQNGQERIVYAWAMDAPALKLPTDVSFGVGGKTGLNYLVLQVHYKNASKFVHDPKAKDHSGVKMTYQTKSTPKLAGVYLFSTGGMIPRGATVHMETACSYNHKVNLHPFAFRTHTHKLGKVVSGFRIRDGVWTEIGRKSPQLPQMFYNTSTPGMEIKNGDMMAARCVMKNFHQDRDVQIGNTQNDEMCNFYMMYWIPAKDSKLLSQPDMSGCNSGGWPDFKWTDMKDFSLKGMPTTTSQIPNSKEILRETVDRDKFVEQMMAEMELAKEEAAQRLQSLIREMEEEELEAEAEAMRNAMPMVEEDEIPEEVDRRGVPFFDFGGDEGFDDKFDPIASNLD